MRFARSLIVFPFIFLFSFVYTKAQKAPSKQSRILILLDGSSSMVDNWQSGQSRYKAAERVILTLMDSVYKVNKDVEFGLRVFGHRHSVTEHNCFDTENEVSFGKNNADQMSLRLRAIRPFGITPIAYSIKEAVETDMVNDAKYVYSLILITDGGESCGGDICDVVRNLLDKRIYFKPYIISLYDSKPLAETYACMGDYMQVTKPEDIGKTVKTIVEAYRPIIRLNESDVQQLRPLSETRTPVEATIRTLKPVEKPIEKPAEKIEKIKLVMNPLFPVKPSLIALKPVAKKAVATSGLPKVSIKNPAPKETLARILPVGKPKTLSLLYTVPTHKEVVLPAIVWKEIKDEEPVATPKPAEPKPKPVVATPKPVATTKPKPVTTKKEEPKPAEVDVKVVTEDAEETSVEVYFTNGKGKFYYSMPRILFKDVKTGTTVHQFFRAIGPDNNPRSEKVTAGTYNVLIAGNGNSMAKNVTILPNKKNKVMITVTTGSLHFQYENNPDRPVSEYEARVAQRSGGTDRVQPCNIDLKYEPGSYHVTVNTLPLSHYYIELDMNYTKVIFLPEPGRVKFIPVDVKETTAQLYTPLGDRYVKFLGRDVGPSSPDDSLNVSLKPGPYEVRFVKDPRLPGSPEKVIPFTVRSNEVVEVELK